MELIQQGLTTAIVVIEVLFVSWFTVTFLSYGWHQSTVRVDTRKTQATIFATECQIRTVAISSFSISASAGRKKRKRPAPASAAEEPKKAVIDLTSVDRFLNRGKAAVRVKDLAVQIPPEMQRRAGQKGMIVRVADLQKHFTVILPQEA